jgi:hypothetical protein
MKPSCASAVERVKLEKINKMELATRNGFDHRAALNNQLYLVPESVRELTCHPGRDLPACPSIWMQKFFLKLFGAVQPSMHRSRINAFSSPKT